MSRRPARLLFLAAVLLLAACGTRPDASTPWHRPQTALNSAQHWQIVATDVASAISAHLVRYTGRKDPVHVAMLRNGDTLFADAFLGAVTTRLVQQGHAVAVRPRGDVVQVGIDTLIVPMTLPRRPPSASQGNGDLLMALGAGVALAIFKPDDFPWGMSAIAAAAAGGSLAGGGPEPDTEMVLTVSIQREDFYTFRSTAVYYVNGRDLGHYQSADGRSSLDLNQVPQAAIAYDLAGKPYLR